MILSTNKHIDVNVYAAQSRLDAKAEANLLVHVFAAMRTTVWGSMFLCILEHVFEVFERHKVRSCACTLRVCWLISEPAHTHNVHDNS